MQLEIGPVCRLARLAATMVAVTSLVSSIASASAGFSTPSAARQARVPPWPCRLVVRPTLLGVVEDGWHRSPTLRRQCDELAAAGAVVVLEWGTTDSHSLALTKLQIHDGVVVARSLIPPVRDAIEHVGHELQHVLERIRGVDFESEARRPGSGVWRAIGGFETQAAIDAGRQVAKELRDASRVRR